MAKQLDLIINAIGENFAKTIAELEKMNKGVEKNNKAIKDLEKNTKKLDLSFKNIALQISKLNTHLLTMVGSITKVSKSIKDSVSPLLEFASMSKKGAESVTKLDEAINKLSTANKFTSLADAAAVFAKIMGQSGTAMMIYSELYQDQLLTMQNALRKTFGPEGQKYVASFFGGFKDADRDVIEDIMNAFKSGDMKAFKDLAKANTDLVSVQKIAAAMSDEGFGPIANQIKDFNSLVATLDSEMKTLFTDFIQNNQTLITEILTKLKDALKEMFEYLRQNQEGIKNVFETAGNVFKFAMDAASGLKTVLDAIPIEVLLAALAFVKMGGVGALAGGVRLAGGLGGLASGAMGAAGGIAGLGASGALLGVGLPVALAGYTAKTIYDNYQQEKELSKPGFDMSDEGLKQRQIAASRHAAAKVAAAAAAAAPKAPVIPEEDLKSLTEHAQTAAKMQGFAAQAMKAQAEMAGITGRGMEDVAKSSATVLERTQKTKEALEAQQKYINANLQGKARESALLEIAAQLEENRLQTMKLQMEVAEAMLAAAKSQLDLLGTQESILNTQLSMYESIYGTAAMAAEATLRVVDTLKQEAALGKQIYEQYRLKRIEAEKTGGINLEMRKTENKYQNDYMQKQLTIIQKVKELRDGYLDAVQQQAIGLGSFNKLITTAEQNVGIGQAGGMVRKNYLLGVYQRQGPAEIASYRYGTGSGFQGTSGGAFGARQLAARKSAVMNYGGISEWQKGIYGKTGPINDEVLNKMSSQLGGTMLSQQAQQELLSRGMSRPVTTLGGSKTVSTTGSDIGGSLNNLVASAIQLRDSILKNSMSVASGTAPGPASGTFG